MMKNLKKRVATSGSESDEEKGEEKGKEKGKEKRGYSPDKDQVIKEVGSIDNESTREGNIIVRICSYNKGPKKIAVMRSGETKDGTPWYSARLGRITPEHAKELIILLKRARIFLKKNV